jgi:hypothetical protein
LKIKFFSLWLRRTVENDCRTKTKKGRFAVKPVAWHLRHNGNPQNAASEKSLANQNRRNVDA